MEKNTVVLSLKDYNDFREMKESVLSGKSLSIYDGHHYEYFTESEIVSKLKGTIKKCEDNVHNASVEMEKIKKNSNILIDRSNELARLAQEADDDLELTVSEIKRMSIWEFLKWRKL